MQDDKQQTNEPNTDPAEAAAMAEAIPAQAEQPAVEAAASVLPAASSMTWA